MSPSVPPARTEVLFVPADDPVAAEAQRVARDLGLSVGTTTRLDTVTVGGRIVIMAGDVTAVAAAVAAGAAAVVAVADPDAEVAALLAAGARAVLPAGQVDRELRAALQAARAGALYVAHWYTGPLRAALDVRAADALTLRELETLRWVVFGHTHRQIAETMGVTEATVNTYLKRLRAKLNVTNKAHLTRVAMSLGLV